MAGIDANRFSFELNKSLQYGDPSYWSKRYQEKASEPFDWYLKWEHLKETVSQWLTPESNVLVLGCGTSLIAEQMLGEGFASKITCVDQCEELVDVLREKYKDKEALEFKQEDAGRLPKELQGKFDLVLDKAVLDTVLCGRQGWAAGESIVKSAMAALKNEGRYVCVSHAHPAQRLPLLSSCDSQDVKFEVSCHPVQRPLDPPPDPKAKGAKAAKGAPDLSSLQASADQKDNMYQVYCCQRKGVAQELHADLADAEA
mmetsp:Transcript_19019/g.35675  ORF Transcript_19019/g.35675 Transcript_19019/m.35675 type:complete len:257 (+) Transcript_19019:62-832(+)